MGFKDVVKNRYSCKKYSERKVDRARLSEILEAGRLAPTAKNLQEQHIYVVESEENLMLLDLGYAAEGAGPLDNHSSRKELSETVSYI